MTAVPAATPVTSPAALTLATEVEDDTHGEIVAAVPDPVNCVVAPAQSVSVPAIVGAALTVTEEVVLHPPLLV